MASSRLRRARGARKRRRAAYRPRRCTSACSAGALPCLRLRGGIRSRRTARGRRRGGGCGRSGTCSRRRPRSSIRRCTCRRGALPLCWLRSSSRSRRRHGRLLRLRRRTSRAGSGCRLRGRSTSACSSCASGRGCRLGRRSADSRSCSRWDLLLLLLQYLLAQPLEPREALLARARGHVRCNARPAVGGI